MLYHVVTCCNVLYHVVTCCNVLYHVVPCCDVLYHVVMCCNILPEFSAELLYSVLFSKLWKYNCLNHDMVG